MSRSNLKRKLTISFLVLSIIVMLIQGFAIYELFEAKRDVQELIDGHYFKVEKANNILDKVNDIGINLRDAVLGYSMGESKEHIKEIDALRNEIGEILKVLEPKLELPKEKELLEKIKKIERLI